MPKFKNMAENHRENLFETEKFVRDIFENEGSGHDWWHIFRVRKCALKIAETGKRMAETRHQFMKSFLEQFFNEWEVKI